ALIAGLEAADAAGASLITLYGGEATTAAALELARDRVAAAFRGAEIEVIDGGQPLYPFIASVE
ncbi:MAG: DAK2 domain-containing protein, partial [Tepidiformaceae bacterium]